MKEQLEQLAMLQEIDRKIDRYESDLARYPEEVQEIARGLVTSRREISEAKERRENLQTQLRQKERELAVEQDKIKRSEKRLLGIKNQKEYNALSREVKLGKKVTGEIEDTILEWMNEIEGITKSLERREKEYEELEASLNRKKTEQQEAESEAAKVLSSLKQEKESLAQGVEREYLKRYETVKKARGTGIAEVSNGSCTACHMAIPPQLHIRLLKQNEFISCPTCQRILYVRPENIPEFNVMQS